VEPFENLFVATGHSMLGITLGPASGQSVAEFVLSGRRPEVLEPFRLRRFASARPGLTWVLAIMW
jgi:glycine/D-amino acid oxidase-like deaminating enzyme